MATAEEKDAKQAVRDVARQSIVQGQQRLATVGQAGSAYPTRRLRSSGDLSRYAIGGFLSDSLPPIKPPPVKPPVKPPSGKPSATKGKTTTTTRYGGPAGHLGGTAPKKPIVIGSKKTFKGGGAVAASTTIGLKPTTTASTGGGARSKTL